MRQAFLIIILFISSASFAADYTWEAYLQTKRGSGYGSATSACQSLMSVCDAADGSNSRPKAFDSLKATANQTVFYCVFEFEDRGSYVNGAYQWISNGRKSEYCGSGNLAYAGRVGDICPSPKVYNPQTGSCEEPSNPCESKAGTTSPFLHSGSIGDSFFFMTAGGLSGTANSGCQSGCEGIVSGAKCHVFAGEPGTYTCGGTLSFTGAQCASGSSDVGSSNSSEPPPAPPTEDNSNGCGSWVSTADGQSQTCASTSSKVNPGTASSGSAPSPSPSSSNDDTTTVTDKKTNPDGSTTTTTSTSTTSTYCTVGNCTTTTTTNTTVTNSDPSGNVTGTSTSCSGPNCSKPSNGTGTGDSSGSGDDGITVIGDSSSVLTEPAKGDFAEAAGEWDAKIVEAKTELQGVLANIKSTVTASASPNLSGGSGSLPCESIQVFGTTFELCFTPFEGALGNIKTVLLFLAAALAFFIIFVRD